jgi:hypothetical protein
LILLACIVTLQLFFVDSVNAQVSDTFRLIGMIRSKNFTGVVVSDSKGEQSFYRVTDKMPDGSQIVELRHNSISLRRTDGSLYDMYIANDTKTVASVASANRDLPPDPYGPGAIRNIDAERQNAQTRPRGRHGRTPSNEE